MLKRCDKFVRVEKFQLPRFLPPWRDGPESSAIDRREDLCALFRNWVTFRKAVKQDF
jgi:hypothetical protein